MLFLFAIIDGNRGIDMLREKIYKGIADPSKRFDFILSRFNAEWNKYVCAVRGRRFQMNK